jgi:hypothetical protein
LAIATDPSIRKSAPLISKIKPAASISKAINNGHTSRKAAASAAATRPLYSVSVKERFLLYTASSFPIISNFETAKSRSFLE